MKTPLPAPPDLHDWGRRNLEVGPDAGASEARAAFLRRLPEFQWVPPAAIEESHAYLSRPDGAKMFPALMEQAVPDEEFRLRTQVDQFAAEFFDLEPAERRERHQRLAAQCAWSVNLSARVQALAAGLNVQRRPWENEWGREEDLSEHLCRLFTLAPAERARRRWQIVQELAPEGDDWEEIARRVRENNPGLASLEPVLLDELTAGETPSERKWGRLPQPAPAPPPPRSPAGPAV